VLWAAVLVAGFAAGADLFTWLSPDDVGDVPGSESAVVRERLDVAGLPLPVEAVLTDLPSIAASLGVVSRAFQEGHPAWLLGSERRDDTNLTVPVLVSGLLMGGFAPMNQIGLRLVLAVALDATVMRMPLVPATMALPGRWNRWTPRPPRRLHGRIGRAFPKPAPAGEPSPGRRSPRVRRGRLTNMGEAPSAFP
jgi:hypothetical protein